MAKKQKNIRMNFNIISWRSDSACLATIRLCVRSVELLVKKYASTVTTVKHITPHKLRSTYGTNLYQASKDIYLVADVLGHKDVNTTRKHYAEIVDENKRSARNIVRLRTEADD